MNEELSVYDEPLLSDEEIERLIERQVELTGSTTEDEIGQIVREMNGNIVGMSIVRMWRAGLFDAVVIEGEVRYRLTKAGAELHDRLRNQDR